MTIGETSSASTSRANAPQPMAPAEKPIKFTGIDFKQWQQKMSFYLTTLCLQRLTSEDAPETKPVAPICIHCDSQAAIGRAGSMMYNSKSRYRRQRHNTIRKILSSGIITVDCVNSKNNMSDPLTKVLSIEGVQRTSKKIDLRPRTSQHGGTMAMHGKTSQTMDNNTISYMFSSMMDKLNAMDSCMASMEGSINTISERIDLVCRPNSNVI
ncbi:hypothetical protein BC332_25308 [Capsicum chinense]|nr:hypothetical protein BC332_25308 [Capsicum chinense]